MSSSSSNKSSQSSMAHSNLECFLDHTTPTIPSKFFLKTCVRDPSSRQRPNKETIEYFTLGDLWQRYGEWSAYGTGVPIILNDGESIVEYYVPYLSAIQVYTNQPLVPHSEFVKLSRASSSNLSRASNVASKDSGIDQPGFLYLEYFEKAPPHERLPLMEKVKQLSHNHPSLATLKSMEISPVSWMAVSWYPIYHIPSTVGNVKELSAAFLTFHSLSPPSQDAIKEKNKKKSSEAVERSKKPKELCNEISLPPFGLATYKMSRNLWINSKTADQERITALFNAADSWLKQLKVLEHHDFNYFTLRF